MFKPTAAEVLKTTLGDIVAADLDYEARYDLVIQAMHLARMAGLQVGISVDPKEPEWPVVFIELPTGQVSWHMPQHIRDWDGHDTAEKFKRIARYRGVGELEVVKSC